MPRIAYTGVARRYTHWYDTLAKTWGKTEIQPRTLLFGNQNIGLYSHCNLKVAGQIACDQQAVLTVMRLDLDIEDRDALEATKRGLRWMFILGDQPQLMGQWEPVPIQLAVPMMVPVRQNIAVILEWEQTHLEIFNAANGYKSIMFHLWGWQQRDVY